MKIGKAHFASSMHTPFYKTLKSEIDHYFDSNQINRKADTAYFVKMVVILMIFLGSYSLILVNPFNTLFLLLMAIVFGISSAMIAFNIGHDASHHAIFKNPRLNDLFAYSFNLIGTNKYIWDIKHNKSHHAMTNIPGYDADIDQTKIARIINEKPVKWYHKYQHIYLPLLYPFFTFFLVFIKDFAMFKTHKMGNFYYERHPKKEWIVLIISKFLYFSYTLIIPFIVLDLSILQFFLGFMVMHMFTGFTLAIILFPVHVQTNVPFPKPNANGNIDNDWVHHEIEVSSNFSANNSYITWFAGGLNLHIIHHLFPNICHIHYPAMNRILRKVSNEYGLVLKEYSLIHCFTLHLNYLKTMGSTAQVFPHE